MRHKSLDNYPASTPRTRRARKRKEPIEITITPLRGFFMALMFLGIPTVSLGSLCFSLLQNNLRLSEKNDELKVIATEVKADIDSLGKEIESLRKHAGALAGGDAQASADLRSATSAMISKRRGLAAVPTRNASLGLPISGSPRLAKPWPPRGGLAQMANPLALLEDAKLKVPELNKDLDLAIKPALEEALEKALAVKAAYPDGQPVVGVAEVSSSFGIRGNPFGGGRYEMHEGIDFIGEQGDIIAATGDGIVTQAGFNGGYGISVTIDHGYGYETLYAHMSEKRVSVGDGIKRGQIIGYIGSTGRSSGPHLHYGIYKNDVAIDPAEVMTLPERQMAAGPR